MIPARRLFFYSCLFFSFSLPLKISFTYVALSLSVLFFFLSDLRKEISKLNFKGERVAAFLLIVFILSSFFAVNPTLSLYEAVRFTCVCLFFIPLSICARNYGWRPLARALVAGQLIAATHSILDAFYGYSLGRVFVGTVSESGQLAITLFVALALVFAVQDKRENEPHPSLIALVISVFTFFILQLVTANYLYAFLCLIFFTVFCLLKFKTSTIFAPHILWSSFCIAILISALICNAKRGPLFAVAVCGLIALLRLSGARGVGAGVLIVLSSWLYQPLVSRLLSSFEHLNIVGGRTTIWEIGYELALRNPLGLGFHSSRLLQNFCDTIPPELTHFHSNYLNILVETGWIGLAVFLLWLFSVLKNYFTWSNSLTFLLSMAFISWHLAGLVEYNFGDKEVFFVGLLSLVLLREYSLRSRMSMTIAQESLKRENLP